MFHWCLSEAEKADLSALAAEDVNKLRTGGPSRSLSGLKLNAVPSEPKKEVNAKRLAKVGSSKQQMAKVDESTSSSATDPANRPTRKDAEEHRSATLLKMFSKKYARA